jgi:hypothetical protein
VKKNPINRASFTFLVSITLTLFSTAGIVAPAEAATNCNGYLVQPNDSLYRIGVKLGVNWQSLAQYNNLFSTIIYSGQCLNVPGGVSAPAPVAAPAPDNGTSAANVAQPAPLAAPLPPVTASGSKGVALLDWHHMEDIDRLGASWYYGWGEYCKDDGRCVNMVRSMQAPRACYDRLLVGNEPNAREPFGHPIDPASAATAVLAIENQCPGTKLIVGNVSADDWNTAGGWGNGAAWLAAFLANYQAQSGRAFSQTLGVHCYTTDGANYCINRFAQMRAVYAGEMWVTEFNTQHGDTIQFTRLLQAINSYGYSAYAVYTNRNDGASYDLPGTAMVLSDGNLTNNGQVYALWK